MKLLGGESIDWSSRLEPYALDEDQDGTEILLRQVLRDMGDGKKALAVGVVHPETIEFLASRYETVDVLTPSVSNGERVERRCSALGNVSVSCGAPERYQTSDRYDLIIAAAGLSSTTTPDSGIQSEQALIELVLSWRDSDSTVVLGIDNHFGLDQFIYGASYEYAPEGDRHWPRGRNAESPVNMQALDDLVDKSGASTSRLFAVYGGLSNASVLADSSSLLPPVDRFLVESASRSYAAKWSSQTLCDPYSNARGVVGISGLGLQIAPAWLLVLGSDDFATDLPNALVVPSQRADLALPALEYSAEKQRWSSSVDGGDRAVNHSVSTIADEWYRFLDAGDREYFATSFKKFVDFVMNVLNDKNKTAFAIPTNIATNVDGSLGLIDSRLECFFSVDQLTAITMNVRRFASDVVASGSRHLWESDLSPNELAVRIALTGGLDISRSLEGATELEIELAQVFDGAMKEDAPLMRAKLTENYARRSTARVGDSATFRNQINAELYATELVKSNQELGRQVKAARQVTAVLRSEISSLKEAQQKKQELFIKQKNRAEKNRGKIVELKQDLNSLKQSRAYRLGRLIAAPKRRLQSKKKQNRSKTKSRPTLGSRRSQVSVNSKTTPDTRRLVSVVVPVYNVEEYLADCINSILEQTHSDFEIILVDDGSTDSSSEIVNEFAMRFENIHAVHQENQGLGGARNTGLKIAKGEFVIFVDSDDLLPTRSLEFLYRAAVRGDADFSIGSYRRFCGNEEEPVSSWIRSVCEQRRIGILPSSFPEVTAHVPVPTKLFRRKFLLENDLYFPPEIFYEDQLFMAKCYATATSISIVPKTVYLYRRRLDETSISQRLSNIKVLTDAREQIQLSVDYYDLHAPALNAGYLDHVLIRLFPGMIASTIQEGAEHRALLSLAAQHLSEVATQGALESIPWSSRTYLFFAAEGMWDQIASLNSFIEKYSRTSPTYVRGGELFTNFMEFDDLKEMVPPEAAQWSPDESRLVGVVLGADWDESSFYVEFYSYIRGLSMIEPTGEIDAYLVDSAGRHVVQSSSVIRSVDALGPDRIAGHKHATYSGSKGVAMFKATDIVTALMASDEALHLGVTLVQSGVVRSVVADLVPRGRQTSIHKTFDAMTEDGQACKTEVSIRPRSGLAIIKL